MPKDTNKSQNILDYIKAMEKVYDSCTEDSPPWEKVDFKTKETKPVNENSGQKDLFK